MPTLELDELGTSTYLLTTEQDVPRIVATASGAELTP